MGRFHSGKSLACVVISCMLMAACSTSSVTTVVVEVVPATVDLCLSPSSSCQVGQNLSLEVGQTGALLATAKNRQGTFLVETFSYQSSNPAVLTVAGNGAVCAGSWNSLTTPQVCTPGPTGVAQVTATAHGVSSPPVTIYVHQHVTGITISRVPNQPPTLSDHLLVQRRPRRPRKRPLPGVCFQWNSLISLPPSGAFNSGGLRSARRADHQRRDPDSSPSGQSLESGDRLCHLAWNYSVFCQRRTFSQPASAILRLAPFSPFPLPPPQTPTRPLFWLTLAPRPR